MRYAQSEVKNK